MSSGVSSSEQKDNKESNVVSDDNVLDGSTLKPTTEPTTKPTASPTTEPTSSPTPTPSATSGADKTTVEASSTTNGAETNGVVNKEILETEPDENNVEFSADSDKNGEDDIVYIIGTDNAVSAAAQTPVTNTPNVDGKTYKRLQVGQSFDAVEFFRNLSGLPNGTVTDIEVYTASAENPIYHIAQVQDNIIVGTHWGKTPVTANVDGKFYVFHLEVRPAGAVAMPMIIAGTGTLFALKADGTVWYWGGGETSTGFGKTIKNITYPKQLTDIKNGIQIAVNQHTVYVLKADGTAWIVAGGCKGRT